MWGGNNMIPYYLKDISDYLELNNIGKFGTDIFLYDFCPGVDNCISLISAKGLPDLVTVDGEIAIIQPELDIRVRNTTGQAAETLANEIHDLLNGMCDVILGNTRLIMLSSLGDPYEISHDVKYTIYGVNFSLMI
jgi:hypothetical protein